VIVKWPEKIKTKARSSTCVGGGEGGKREKGASRQNVHRVRLGKKALHRGGELVLNSREKTQKVERGMETAMVPEGGPEREDCLIEKRRLTEMTSPEGRAWHE